MQGEPQGGHVIWQHLNVPEYFMAINEISPLEAADTASNSLRNILKWRATIPRFVRAALRTCDLRGKSTLLGVAFSVGVKYSVHAGRYFIKVFCFDFSRNR